MTSGSTRMNIYDPLSSSNSIEFNWNVCLLCVVKVGPLFFVLFFMCIQVGKCWERISWSYTIVVKRDLLMKDCSYSWIRHRERRIAKEEAVTIVRLIYSPFQISMEWKSQWLHDSLSLRFIFIRSSCLFTNTISSSLSIKHATGQSSQTQNVNTLNVNTLK